jgi:hypothetical protein
MSTTAQKPKTSRKASTNDTKQVTLHLAVETLDSLEMIAAHYGITSEECVVKLLEENFAKKTRTETITAESLEAIRIDLPPEIVAFLSEAYEAAGENFDYWHDAYTDMIRGELLDTFSASRVGGIQDNIRMSVDERHWPKVDKVISRWRGKFVAA